MSSPSRKRFRNPVLFFSFASFFLWCVALQLDAQKDNDPIPHIVQRDGRYALFVDGAPYLMLGAQINNSSAWPAMLPKVWPAIEAIHANTVEMPVYWEQMEPQDGRFDFTVVDALITQARAHRVHLVLLWFGTWKNGSSHYMPLWLRNSPETSPHVIGANGRAVDSPSPYSAVTLKDDIRAFAALMNHLKADDHQRTVLMVQVENEPGTWGSVRDYSPDAQKLFEAPVPADLLAALHQQGDSRTGSKPSAMMWTYTSTPGRSPDTSSRLRLPGKLLIRYRFTLTSL